MIATIGYERSELPDFIATLQLAGVQILIDIRDRAQSRRPGFSKSALSSALLAAGIDYLHYPELGDPKEGREAARSGDIKLFRDIFGKVLESEAAQTSLKEIEAFAENKLVCLMCYERNQQECHRKIVADDLELRLKCRAQHLGVRQGVHRETATRSVRDLDKGPTASIQLAF